MRYNLIRSAPFPPSLIARAVHLALYGHPTGQWEHGL